MSMKLPEVLEAANEVYPGGYLLMFYDPEAEPDTDPRSGDCSDPRGDTLARFIVNEICELWGDSPLDPDDPSSATEKITECAEALRKAETEVGAVAAALEALARGNES